MTGSRFAHRLRTIDPRYFLPGARRFLLRVFGRQMPRRVPTAALDYETLYAIASTPICPSAVDPVVDAADKFLLGGLHVLGREMQPWIDSWLSDPRTGYEWPVSGKPDGAPGGSDVKAPWEISRFYFAPWLAGAAVETRDSRYAEALVELVQDWSAQNPPGQGINWTIPMEVAIRGANLAVAVATLSRQQDLYEPAHKDFEPLLAAHGAFVARNLEAGPGPPTNHLLVGAAGLALIGGVLGHRRWLDRARRVLERQAVQQVRPDGSHVEASPSYHRFCMEALIAAAWVFRALGRPAKTIEESVHRMARFTTAYTRPDGSAPELGDADDGRFIVPTGMYAHERTHHQYLRWLLPQDPIPGGAKPHAQPGDAKPHAQPGGVEAFDGYVFLRNDDEWASFRCGRFGRYGGHVHADQLHSTWSHGSHNVLIDPGTGAYSGDPSVRNRLRSGVAHNAPVIDGTEPNRWDASDLFYMADTTRAQLLDTGSAWARGRHHGYRPVEVTRRVEIGNGLTINDEIGGGGEHGVRWVFIFDGDWDISETRARGSIGGAAFVFTWPDSVTGVLAEVERSPAYGELVPATAIELDWTGAFPARFEFSLSPVTAG